MRLIDADILSDYLYTFYEYADYITVGQILNNIDEQPTIDSECKTGQWIQLTCDSAEWWYCSECNGRVQMNPWAKYNYCPNCGANMRSEQNE